MKNKFSKSIRTIISLVVMLTMLVPAGLAFAADTPPTTISPPMNFAAVNYGGYSVVCTLSAPDDLRALIDKKDLERGYPMKILGQVDFKVDNGSWHYTSDWDNPKTYTKYTLNYYNDLFGGDSGQYLGHEQLTFKNMFPSDKNVPVPDAWKSWDWYKSHKMTLKARFAIDFGSGRVVFSDWTPEYVLSADSKMDHKKILADNPPILKSATVEKNKLNNRPYMVLQLDRHPTEIQKLNAAAGCKMQTEVWLRKNGEKDFKKIGAVSITQEKIQLDVSAYFGNNVQSYDAAAYEIKTRYCMDERAYEQSGVTTFNMLYGTYSNIISYNMPAWTGASTWATSELKQADDYGLIPDSLKGKDLTQPISREEFAELAVRLYEKTTGKKAEPSSPNPFTDTTNPEILKAFNVGITTGTSKTTFSPKELITREQIATMLSRAIRIMVPNGDFSTSGAPALKDQKDIASYALDHVLFMCKIGIIKPANGIFSPKAISSAQKASGYGNATREQAVLMGVRTFEIYKTK